MRPPAELSARPSSAGLCTAVGRLGLAFHLAVVRLTPMLRLAVRTLLARPSRTLLTLIGIVLGVAVILAIRITNLRTVESI